MECVCLFHNTNTACMCRSIVIPFFSPVIVLFMTFYQWSQRDEIKENPRISFLRLWVVLCYAWREFSFCFLLRTINGESERMWACSTRPKQTKPYRIHLGASSNLWTAPLFEIVREAKEAKVILTYSLVPFISHYTLKHNWFFLQHGDIWILITIKVRLPLLYVVEAICNEKWKAHKKMLNERVRERRTFKRFLSVRRHRHDESKKNIFSMKVLTRSKSWTGREERVRGESERW